MSCCQWTYETLSLMSLASGSPAGQSPHSERLLNKDGWTFAASMAGHRAPWIKGPWIETRSHSLPFHASCIAAPYMGTVLVRNSVYGCDQSPSW